MSSSGSLPDTCLGPARTFILASRRLLMPDQWLRERARRLLKTWMPLCLLRIMVAVSLLVGTMAFEAKHAHASPVGIGTEEQHRDPSSHSKTSCHATLRCNVLSTGDSLVLPVREARARRIGPIPQSDLGSGHILRIATPPPRYSV